MKLPYGVFYEVNGGTSQTTIMAEDMEKAVEMFKKNTGLTPAALVRISRPGAKALMKEKA